MLLFSEFEAEKTARGPGTTSSNASKAVENNDEGVDAVEDNAQNGAGSESEIDVYSGDVHDISSGNEDSDDAMSVTSPMHGVNIASKSDGSSDVLVGSPSAPGAEMCGLVHKVIFGIFVTSLKP